MSQAFSIVLFPWALILAIILLHTWNRPCGSLSQRIGKDFQFPESVNISVVTSSEIFQLSRFWQDLLAAQNSPDSVHLVWQQAHLLRVCLLMVLSHKASVFSFCWTGSEASSRAAVSLSSLLRAEAPKTWHSDQNGAINSGCC